MKARNLVVASTLVVASFPALAVGTPENMVISASSYTELAAIYDNIHPTSVADAGGTPVAIPEPLCASGLPSCVVVSAKDYVELGAIGDTLSAARDSATETVSVAGGVTSTMQKGVTVSDKRSDWGGFI
jgi:hypothetical protein